MRCSTPWSPMPATGVACLEADPESPLPMAVRPSLAGPAAALLLAAERRSLRALVAAVPSVAVPSATWRRLDPDGVTLRDVDTPGDLGGLRHALGLAAERARPGMTHSSI